MEGESYIQKLYRIPVEYLTLEEVEDYERLEERRLKQKMVVEERELEKYPLVGAHEDGRKAEGAHSMSLASWQRIENSRRAGEDVRARTRHIWDDGRVS